MSRDLKFRAWDGSRMHLWVEGDPSLGRGVQDSFLRILHQTKWTLMQYTGLKDKHGREIYEGDIIKWGDHCDWCHEDPIRIAKVSFNPDIQFHSQVGVFKFGQFAYQDTHKHIEVIGNTYENPELLKQS